jgi:hypothetical protein
MSQIIDKQLLIVGPNTIDDTCAREEWDGNINMD